MRKLVFALLLLCSALFATAQEWQWSVQLKGFISSETGKELTAFLWIPSDCHQLRAVMVGKHNMSEETLFEMPRFGKHCPGWGSDWYGSLPESTSNGM